MLLTYTSTRTKYVFEHNMATDTSTGQIIDGRHYVAWRWRTFEPGNRIVLVHLKF